MESNEHTGFEIKRNEIVGRYAVACNDIKAGDVILNETPFAFGPKTDSPPLCLGCYNSVNCLTLCSQCGWPVCRAQCESVPAHKNNECPVFVRSRAKFQMVTDVTKPCLQYECITPLRVLLAMRRDAKRWEEEVAMLESHESVRKTQPLWEFYHVNVVKYLRGPCKLDEFGEELIHKVCGILDVNTFEAPTLSGNSIRCLYPKMAMLSHNCVSNTRHTIFTAGSGDVKDFQITLHASVDITRGTSLFCSYAYSLWPTLLRREYIKESKYFECTCSRCEDPTELGTHMSSLKCMKCPNGELLSTAPLDSNSSWKCTNCEYGVKNVKKLFTTVMTDINFVDEHSNAIEEAENVYRKYIPVLHNRNAFFTMLQVSLVQMYGRLEGYSSDLIPHILLERKYEMCRQILQTIDVIEPGFSRLRGIILYELHCSMLLLAKNLYDNGLMHKDDLIEKKRKAVELLQESYTILQVEPTHTKAGIICKCAKQILNNLQGELNDIKNT